MSRAVLCVLLLAAASPSAFGHAGLAQAYSDGGGTLGIPPAVHRFLADLDSPSAQARREGVKWAYGIAQRSSPQDRARVAGALLERVRSDADAQTRKAACQALATLLQFGVAGGGTMQIVTALSAAAGRDPAPEVRGAALESLLFLYAQATGDALYRLSAIKALRSAAVADPERSVRLLAIRALARGVDWRPATAAERQGTMEDLRRVADRDTDGELCFEAAEGLAWLAPPFDASRVIGVIERQIAAERDPDAAFRSVELLRRLFPQDRAGIAAAMGRTLDHPVRNARSLAAYSLQEWGRDAAPARAALEAAERRETDQYLLAVVRETLAELRRTP